MEHLVRKRTPHVVQYQRPYLTAGELTIGMKNGFIVLVNCSGWLKRNVVSLTDIILISRALSKVCILYVMFLDGFAMLLSADTYAHGELMSTLDVFWTISNHLSIWFTFSLSIFHLLRIATISHPIFLLQLKINSVFLGILLISFLISFIISVLNEDSWYHFKVNHEKNITWEFKVNSIPNAFKQVTLNLGAIAPFIFCLILLLFSLFKHTRMKLDATGSRDSSTGAHMRALKVVIAFLLLLMMFYAVFMTSSFLIPQGSFVVMFGGIITVIFSSSYSLILIMGNSKLREAFLKVLRIVKGFHNMEIFCSVENHDYKGKEVNQDSLPSPN
ncbi:LOW QUALITY PROTEIN: taste receptor type 2 member 9 [Molossus nigricans]